MSALTSGAAGQLIIADYVNIDSAGKVNIIGGGIHMIGFDPENGVTAPFALFASVSAKLIAGEDNAAAVEIVLVDSDGQAVDLPGPAGPQKMRIAQNVEFGHVLQPGMPSLPAGFPARHNMAMNFPNGLPLALGKSYEWVIQMDHELIAKVSFFVPGIRDAPVVG